MTLKQLCTRPHRKSVFVLIHAIVLTLFITMAVPAQAAGDRSIKTRVAPSYPEIAKRMRVFGKVKVEATVDPEGKVTAVKTIDGNHLLAMAAEDAVRRWKFEPGNATSTEEVDIDFPRLP